MASVYGSDLARVAITYENGAGNQAVNVLWFEQKVSGVDDTTIGILTSVIAGWLASDWADVANQDWKAVMVEARGWDSPEQPYDIQPLDIPGSLTGEPLPSEVTIAISLRTGMTGRSRRGRLYHVGVGEDNSTGDYISSGYRAALITAYAALITQAAALDWTWVVASSIENGAPRLGMLQTPITQIVIVDTVLDSMRKRRPTAF